MDRTPEQEPNRTLPPRGTVVLYGARAADQHERVTHRRIARRLAALMGFDFQEVFDPERRYRRPVYFVPNDTLLARDALRLGIRDEHDLFGGVVPHAFVGTKLITHPLAHTGAQAPDGWSSLFGELVRNVVLDGVSAFSVADARRGAAQLIDTCPVRVKLPNGIGGRGQVVIDDLAELDAILDAIGDEALATSGVVLEENLEDIETFSVGLVRVGHLVAAYFGMQKLTRDNGGEEVYGGTDLFIANGGYDALLGLGLPEDAQLAVMQAQTYDAAARECYPGFFASRRNYDVARGRTALGEIRSGVLEQSWRIGGASSVEIAALEAFLEDPDLVAVRVSGFERYGDGAVAPPDATVYFEGTDESVGPIVKYTVVEEHVHTR